MMVGVELVADRATNAAFPATDRAAWRVCREAMARGLRVRPLGDVLVLMPPLGTPDPLLERMVAILADAVSALYPETER